MAAEIRAAGSNLGKTATWRKGRVAGTYEKTLPKLRYIIAYTLHPLPDGSDSIVILHVIHGARDWPAETWPKA